MRDRAETETERERDRDRDRRVTWTAFAILAMFYVLIRGFPAELITAHHHHDHDPEPVPNSGRVGR